MVEQTTAKQSRVGQVCFVVHGGAIRQGIIVRGFEGLRTVAVKVMSSLTGEELGEIITMDAHATIEAAIKDARHQRDTLDASIREWEAKPTEESNENHDS